MQIFLRSQNQFKQKRKVGEIFWNILIAEYKLTSS